MQPWPHEEFLGALELFIDAHHCLGKNVAKGSDDERGHFYLTDIRHPRCPELVAVWMITPSK
jgi:hypothetical protein